MMLPFMTVCLRFPAVARHLIGYAARASRALIFVAADLASRYVVKLWLVTVVQSREIPEGLRQWAHAEHISDAPEWMLENAVASNVLVAAEDRARERGISDVETIVAKGNVAEEITAAAERHGAGMLVLGTRGLSDLQGLVMGSVAHKVSHIAPCTVVTVR